MKVFHMDILWTMILWSCNGAGLNSSARNYY